jgi:hypothetical protein
MPQFSRRTILAATDLVANSGHTNIDRFLLEYGLEETVRGHSMADRANALGRHSGALALHHCGERRM